jgi:1-acyl-sn-glycerol-3-phosphate acyltransferase
VNHKNPQRWLLLPFALWACAAFLLLGLIVLLLILPVPWQSLRRRMVRGAARAALLACGMRWTLRHGEHLPEAACVVVANHASYLDGVALYAALPPRFGFVIKREMSRVPLADLLLRRIGSHYVDRGSSHKGALDTRRLLRRAHGGDALAFFPEGTFGSQPGLAAFRSGAFAIAARARLPIVPVAIRGTRALLPGGSFIPRPGRIQIELAPPLPPPASTGRQDVGDTVNAARQAILARIHEPDLDARN